MKSTLYYLVVFSAVASLQLLSLERVHAQFSEGFETASFSSWAYIENGPPVWFVVTDAGLARSGNRAMLANAPAATMDDWALPPPITVTAGVNDQFSLWARASTANGTETVRLYLAPNAGTTLADFTVPLTAGIAPGTAYQRISVDLTAYLGQTIRIGIRAEGTAVSGADGILFDDIISGPLTAPSCLALPVITAVDRFRGTLHNLFWTGTPNAFEYDVLVVPAGTAVSASTTPTGRTTGISAAVEIPLNTTQQIYVRARCPGGGQSAWSTPTTVTYAPCGLITNLQANGISGFDAVVSFDPVPGAVRYDVGIANAGDPAPAFLTPPNTSTTGTIFGLDNPVIRSGAPVVIYVRSVCADGSIGEWVGTPYQYQPCELQPGTGTIGTAISDNAPQLVVLSQGLAVSYDIFIVDRGTPVDLQRRLRLIKPTLATGSPT